MNNINIEKRRAKIDKEFADRCKLVKVLNNKLSSMFAMQQLKDDASIEKACASLGITMPCRLQGAVTIDYIKSLVALVLQQVTADKDAAHKVIDDEIAAEQALVAAIANTSATSNVEENIFDVETLDKCPGQTAELFKFQHKAASALYDGLAKDKKRALLLLAGVGTGKTFIFGQLVAWLQHKGFLDGKTLSPWPILIVTKASVVEQTARVIRDKFGLNTVTQVIVTNYDQLRASLGDLFVKESSVVKQGVIHITYEWHKIMHPCVIIWDECQAIKNEDSTQTKLAIAYSHMTYTPHTYQVFSSATPFTKPIEAKAICLAARLCTEETWPSWIKSVSAPAQPDDNSPSAVERLMTKLRPFVVEVKGVRPKFKPTNKTTLIEFEKQEERDKYNKAWEDYLIECAKIDKNAPEGRFALLAQFLKFRQAAELIRARYLAKWASNTVAMGMDPVIACNFKTTIAKVCIILCEEYGFSRKDISLIWGGLVTKEPKSKSSDNDKGYTDADILRIIQNLKANPDISPEVVKKLEKDLTEQLDNAYLEQELGDVRTRIETFRLGAQNRSARQQEIDRFQSGKSRICLFTFKSGGVGLSLHHTDEQWPLDPITSCKNPTSRQRRTILTPTYSAIELVQGLGRAPRLTSLSDTEQLIVFYKNTIEEHVYGIVSAKLRCLRKVVAQKEHWDSVILKSSSTADVKTNADGIPTDDVASSDTDTEADDDPLLGGESDSNDDNE